MKIGIISMQRVANYGSFLQAYGLKSIIEKIGHEVCFIDYKEGLPVVPYNKKALVKYKVLNISGIKFLNDRVKYYILGHKNFVYEYRMFYLRSLGIGYKYKRPKVDIAVIGSDEVFNCLQDGFNVGFSPMLFGQNIKASKVISYAASFGFTDLNGIKSYDLEKELSKYLRTFTRISVRDENSMMTVEKLTDNKPEVHLDPVLIADFKIPDIHIQYKHYVILYTYKSREYSPEEKALIIEFCKKNNKDLISIGNAQDWVDIHIHASPLELLAYINAADFIITDTFHGSVFSIKYNRKFATLIRNNNKQKLQDLLYRLHQEDRIITSFDELQVAYEKSMDFSETNIIIEREKKHTIEYFREVLE